MKTMTLKIGSRDTSQYRASGPTSEDADQRLSARGRIANRDWYPGLCTSCSNASDCTFPRSMTGPVIECDEFEGIVAVAPATRPADPEPTNRFAVANREWYPGLCLTCEKREGCTFPKPEGGVFSCDEFE